MPTRRSRKDSAQAEAKRKIWLVDQDIKSLLFHEKLHEYGLLEIAYEIEEVRGETLDWTGLCISEQAWNKVIHQGIKPVRVFAHPHVLSTIPRSVGYYRGLAMVSRKSMSNIGLDITADELGIGRNEGRLDAEKAKSAACRFNELISRLVEADERLDPREFDLWRGMTAGATADGSARNKKGAAGEEIIKSFISRRLEEQDIVVNQQLLVIKERGSKSKQEIREFTLEDERLIRFTSEPDVALYDTNGQIQAALEVKGGIDPAGILERIGAAIKSLSRAKQENPAAITILILYGISLTEQGRRELTAHKQEIDYWFTIEDVIDQETTREAIYRLLGI